MMPHQLSRLHLKKFPQSAVGIAAAVLTVAGAVTAGTIASLSIAPEPSNAVEFADGRIAFNSPPRMIDTSNSPDYTRARNATFRFAFEVPPNAGEPLSYVEILRYSGPEDLDFRLENVSAYAGASLRGGPEVPISSVSLDEDYEPGDRNTESLGVTFNPPIQPGNTVTVVLKSRQNPRRGGNYLYDVIVYPDPVVGVGQRMGYANFTINDRGFCNRAFC